MTVTQAENTSMRDKIYYTLNIFPKDGGNGIEYPNIFWRIGNAKKRMRKLIDSGKYESITLRKEEVWYRNASNEFGCSSPIEHWKREETTT